MTKPVGDVGAIVLAAGGSSRLGSPKQLVVFDGKTLIARAIDAVAAAREVVVVIGAYEARIRVELDAFDVCIAHNEAWRDGQATSLSLGLRSLTDAMQAAVVTTCDQPFADASHINALIAAWRGGEHCCVATRYGDAFGTPAVIPRLFFGELLGGSGDVGARTLLRSARAKTVTIDCARAGFDVDTPADLRQLQTQR